MINIIHINPTKARSSLTLIFLLIPIIFFILISAFVLNRSKEYLKKASITQTETVVLGEETENK